MKKQFKHKVIPVMLPVNEEGKKGDIIASGKHLFTVGTDYYSPYSGCYKKQYLYITISQDVEPIKEGDWAESNGKIMKIDSAWFTFKGKSIYRKIIATTDPKLTNKRVCFQCDGTGETTFSGTYNTQRVCDVCNGDKILGKPIPQLQQSFIKEYVANPDGEWEVEYNVFLEMNDPKGKYTEYKLKLNQDNTINISSVEEKMYSREEIILFGEYLMKLNNSIIRKHSIMKPLDDKTGPLLVRDLLDNWIKENL